MTCYVISMVYTLWNLSGKYGFQWNERWYEHVPDTVLENEDYRMLRDFSIQTDHEIEARRLDLLVIDQKKEQLQHYRRGNYGQWKMEGCEQKRISKKNTKISQDKFIKRCKVNDDDDAHSGGGIGDDTAEVKRKSEDHRCRHIHSTYSKICPFMSARVLRNVLEM